MVPLDSLLPVSNSFIAAVLASGRFWPPPQDLHGCASEGGTPTGINLLTKENLQVGKEPGDEENGGGGGRAERWCTEREGRKEERKKGTSHQIFQNAHKMAAASWSAAASPSGRLATGAFMKAAIDSRPAHLHGQLAKRMFICGCPPFHSKLARSRSGCPEPWQSGGFRGWGGEPALPKAILAWAFQTC